MYVRSKCFDPGVRGVEAKSRFHLRASDFGPCDGRLNRTHYSSCNFVLEIKYIVQGTIDLIGPKMSAGNCVDELASDAHPAAGLSHATFQNVTNSELAPDQLYVDRSAFVGEA